MTLLDRVLTELEKIDARNKLKYGAGIYCCELSLCSDGSGDIQFEYDPRCGHEPIEEIIVAYFDSLNELEEWLAKQEKKKRVV